MNVAFEKQIYLLKQSLPSSMFPVKGEKTGQFANVVKSPELSQF